MYKTLRIMLVLSVLFTFTSQAIASQASDSINNFAFSAGKILAREGNSYFFSPFSIISAFGMAYAGASGDTRQEIENVLGFTPEVHESLGALVQDMEESGYVSSANRVWLASGLNLRDSYKSIISQYYGAETPGLDFMNDTENARTTINDWVSAQTNHRIKNLLRMLNPATRMILTNAIYFREGWQKEFDEDMTKNKLFYYDGYNSVEVPMMIQNDDFDYAEVDGVKVIRLPYSDRRLSMIIALGENIKLNAEVFNDWMRSFRKYDVDLWLPKFRTEKRYELKTLLRVMGINYAFSDYADFSGITDSEALKIDQVIHQTFIDVNEKETEAAASTAIMMLKATAMPMMRQKKEFHADRPFTYFIVDGRSRAILFMGQQTFKE